MSGWQVSGDAPSFYTHYAYAMRSPWTDDLILQAGCKDGDRVLDVACGPGLVAGKVNGVSKGPLERQLFDTIFQDGVRAFFGPAATAPAMRGMSLNTYAELRRLATDAGFTDVQIRFEHRTARYPDPAELLIGWTQAPPNAAQFRALSDPMRDRFIAHLMERLESFVDDGGIAIPRENHYLLAAK